MTLNLLIINYAPTLVYKVPFQMGHRVTVAHTQMTNFIEKNVFPLQVLCSSYFLSCFLFLVIQNMNKTSAYPVFTYGSVIQKNMMRRTARWNYRVRKACSQLSHLCTSATFASI